MVTKTPHMSRGSPCEALALIVSPTDLPANVYTTGAHRTRCRVHFVRAHVLHAAGLLGLPRLSRTMERAPKIILAVLAWLAVSPASKYKGASGTSSLIPMLCVLQASVSFCCPEARVSDAAGSALPAEVILDEPSDTVALNCGEEDALMLRWRVFMPTNASDHHLDWQIHVAHGRSSGLPHVAPDIKRTGALSCLGIWRLPIPFMPSLQSCVCVVCPSGARLRAVASRPGIDRSSGALFWGGRSIRQGAILTCRVRARIPRSCAQQRSCISTPFASPSATRCNNGWTRASGRRSTCCSAHICVPFGMASRGSRGGRGASGNSRSRFSTGM